MPAIKEATVCQNTIKYNSHDFKKGQMIVDKDVGGKEDKYNIYNKINNKEYHLKQNQKVKLEEN